MKYLSLIFLLGICSIISLNAQDEKAKVYIDKATYLVQFEKTKQGEVHATLDVTRNFVSETALKYKISESIFFDENSEIKKIKKNKKKVKPIISDYQSDGIFHSDLKLCYFEHTFLTSGSEARISYQKKFTDIKYLDPLYFVDRYEVDDIVIEIRKPDWLELNIVEWNFDIEQVDKSVKTVKDETIYTYRMTDLNSYTKVKGLPSISKVYAHLILNPVAATIDGNRVTLLESTGDLYSWYAKLVTQIGNDASPLNSLVSELTKDASTDLEKIKVIYYWVQDNIRYIAFENGIMGFRPEACQSVYNNKYGDCKGMANLTKEMLIIAGIDARLTWIGTNTLPYNYSVPSLIVDNHMICAAMIDGEPLFLDATEKNSDLYEYASRIQGKEVLIEDGDNFILSKVPEDKQLNKETYKATMKFDGEFLVGDVEMISRGGLKSSMAYYLSSIAAKDRKEFVGRYLNNGDKNISIDVVTEDLTIQRDVPYQVNYKMKLANRILEIGNELYFNPETEFTFHKFEKFKNRDIPYDMGREAIVQFETKIAVPSGYSVQYLPEAIKGEGDGFLFDLSYTQEGGSILYKKNISITKLTIEPSEFEKLNTIIDQLQIFYSDQIILEKS